MFLLLAAAAAASTDPTAPGEVPAPESPWVAPEGGLAPIDLTLAEPLEPVDRAGFRFLAPRHWRLPANTRGQTDFTAYTLEFGEVRLGLAGIAIGILPRTQLATIPALDALGVLNGQVKVNVLRVGPVDLGGSARVYNFAGKTMDAAYLSGGGTVSVTLAPAWSVHGGAEWSSFAAAGTPNLDPLLPFVDSLVGIVPDAATLDHLEDGLSFSAQARTVTVRAATDVRFNRRDSLILQGQAMVWGAADLPFEVPAAITGGAPLQNAEGSVPITDAYAASLSYQLAMKHLELRVGVGVSSVPGAWLMQSTELAYRFGGPTRSTERRMLRGWRQNKRGKIQEARVDDTKGQPT